MREFSDKHIDEDCRGMSGTHENELFFNCVFDRLQNLSLINCDLNQSKFKTSSIKDAMGFAMTLDCFSFRGVEYSPILFDLLLLLMTLTTGNDEKRRQIVEILGKDRYESMKRLLGVTE